MKIIADILREMGWDIWLDDLARRVDRNVVEHTNPDKFHEEKSEIVNDLRKMRRGEKYVGRR